MVRTHDTEQIRLGGGQDPLLQTLAFIRIPAGDFRTEQRRLGAAMILQHFPAEQQHRLGSARAQLADQLRCLFDRRGQNS